MNHAQSKIVLTLASIYNFIGSFGIIFFLDPLAPLIDFEPTGNMFFRLFVGGTGITFGLAYVHVLRSGTYRSPLLFLGAGLKYWAFIAALVSYRFFGLSLSVLFMFGLLNLCFAVLFTLILRSGAANTEAP